MCTKRWAADEKADKMRLLEVPFMNCRVILSCLFCVAFVEHASCAESMAYERFASADISYQRDVLVKAFEERVLHAKNLYYRCTVTLEVRKNEGGKESETIENSKVENVYSHWQLSDNYRMNIEIYRAWSHDPIQLIGVSRNAREGFTKNIFRAKEIEDRIFGRIDTKLDPIVEFNLFTFWLQGGGMDTTDNDVPHEPYPYLFPHLLANVEKWNIVCLPENEMVQLFFKSDSKYYPVENSIEERTTLMLAPDKGFMPVKGHYHHSMTFGGVKGWREANFFVEESQPVSNVWMPVSLKIVSQSVAIPDKFSIKKVKISDMIHGNVTESDIFLEFPEGTEVTDAINGIAYKTDTKGEPIQSTIEPLYGLDPSHARLQVPKPDRTINWMLIAVGVVMILVALYMLLQKRRNAS